MQKFVKDNVVLVLGISLPILLVIFFTLVSIIPNYLVENPKYDFVFSDNPHSNIEFVVIKQKIHFRVIPERFGGVSLVPRVYRYFSETGNVQEIPFVLPDEFMKDVSENSNLVNTEVVVSVDPNHLPSTQEAQDASRIASEISGGKSRLISPVEELAGIKLDNSLISPDGYKFIGSGGYGGGSLLFGTGSHYKNSVISKNGRSMPILYTGKEYYNYPVFIGWIIP